MTATGKGASYLTRDNAQANDFTATAGGGNLSTALQPSTAISVAALTASGLTTLGGAVKSGNASVPAAPTAGAQAGGSPPAPVLVAGSNDTAGSITFGTGTTPALGDMVDVVFGTAYAATPKAIMVVATNAVTGLKQPCQVAKSTTGFSIGLAVAPAASQANTVYAVDYLVIA